MHCKIWTLEVKWHKVGLWGTAHDCTTTEVISRTFLHQWHPYDFMQHYIHTSDSLNGAKLTHPTHCNRVSKTATHMSLDPKNSFWIWGGFDCNHQIISLRATFLIKAIISSEELPRKMRTQIKRVAVCGSVLQCVAVCCSVLQCVAVCCCCSILHHQFVAVCGRVLQCVAVCCSMLQHVAVCCSAL